MKELSMGQRVQILDCTLRDGAYIVDAKFGTPAIKGIIKRMQDANIEIVECGWLKDQPYEEGTSFFHVPGDVEPYLLEKKAGCVYTVMIDWDRYNLDNLPVCDHKTIDAIRVVFPHGKHREGIEVGKQIENKGYEVFYQAANTLAYSDSDLRDLAAAVNETNARAISIVDTFGAMYHSDLERMMHVLDESLRDDITIGFHSHNNQQLSFALSIHFVEQMLLNSDRNIMVDASLCGMGRGAGNATTELIANYLNRNHSGHYDMDMIMDAIDTYMDPFQEKYTWGYSTPYFIAGMYCCHVNNIAYLIKNHRTSAKDMRNIIESLSPDDRKKYDYDLLEKKYIENQNRQVDDEQVLAQLCNAMNGRKVLLIAPGKSVNEQKEAIWSYIRANDPVIIDVNAVTMHYPVDYLFLINKTRYDYAKDAYAAVFHNAKKILLSNIKSDADNNELIVKFNRVMKTGWEHFDNAVIYCLRLLALLNVGDIAIAGFDQFEEGYNVSYADEALPTTCVKNCDRVNAEIKNMLSDFMDDTKCSMKITFVTSSGLTE